MAAVELPVKFESLKYWHWDWLKQRAAPVLCEDTKGIVASRGARILAIAAFDSWSHNACLAHIAVESPMVLRHGFLEEIGRYVFETCERKLMLGLTPADNEAALRFNRKVGMRQVYRIPNGYRDGVDYVLQEMRKDECRWLDNGFRKRKSNITRFPDNVATSSRPPGCSIHAA